MNETVIMLLINDDAEVQELLDLNIPMSTAYRYFSRKQALVDEYERAHKALAKLRLKKRAEK